MSHKPEFNRPAPHAIDLLLSRRSGSAKAMKEPGPSKKQLAQILPAGGRRARHPPHAIGVLLSRRSGSAKAMKEPGPSKKQLAQILQAGARAPDHGKLFPWRFIVFEGKGRERAGDIRADVMEVEGERDKQVEEERGRFLRAPVVIGVVSAAREQHKIPVWEQELSAGAVCQN